jgi:hypothetical protein
LNQPRQLMLVEFRRRNFDTTILTYMHGVTHSADISGARPITDGLEKGRLSAIDSIVEHDWPTRLAPGAAGSIRTLESLIATR